MEANKLSDKISQKFLFLQFLKKMIVEILIFEDEDFRKGIFISVKKLYRLTSRLNS